MELVGKPRVSQGNVNIGNKLGARGDNHPCHPALAVDLLSRRREPYSNAAIMRYRSPAPCQRAWSPRATGIADRHQAAFTNLYILRGQRDVGFGR